MYLWSKQPSLFIFYTTVSECLIRRRYLIGEIVMSLLSTRVFVITLRTEAVLPVWGTLAPRLGGCTLPN